MNLLKRVIFTFSSIKYVCAENSFIILFLTFSSQTIYETKFTTIFFLR